MWRRIPSKIGGSQFDRKESDRYFPRFLVHILHDQAIGGPHLLYALQKSQGFASWRTVGRHYKIPRLLPSIGIPSVGEINSNITSFFDPVAKPQPTPLQNGNLPGNIVMVDGLALETRCHYCPKRDSILGLCHEHSHNVDLKVVSLNLWRKSV